MLNFRPAWYQFRLASLFLTMTVVCLVSWAYVNRSYLAEDTRLTLQKPSSLQRDAALQLLYEETTIFDWPQLYFDGITLLLTLVGLAAIVAWLNIRSHR